MIAETEARALKAIEGHILEEMEWRAILNRTIAVKTLENFIKAIDSLKYIKQKNGTPQSNACFFLYMPRILQRDDPMYNLNLFLNNRKGKHKMNYGKEMEQIMDSAEEHFDYILRPCVEVFRFQHSRVLLFSSPFLYFCWPLTCLT